MVSRSFVVLWAFFHGCQLASAQKQAGDTADLAQNIVPQLADKIVTKFPNQAPRVAVFPVADSQGQVTSSIGETSVTLQGELIFQLQNKSEGRFFVLSKAALARTFRDKGVDPTGVDARDPNVTAQTLKRIDIDAAVIGSFDVKNAAEATANGLVRTAFTVVFRDSSFRQDVTSKDPPQVIEEPKHDAMSSGRFKVDILVEGETDARTLLVSKNPNSEFFNVYFLELEPTDVGKRYSIRLTNLGKPAVGYSNGSDSQRIYAAAVLIDGVSSILQPDAKGRVDFVAIHPKHTSKWILSPPGSRVDKGEKVGEEKWAGQVVEIYSPKLIPDSSKQGMGGAIVDVPGFQRSLQKAASFTFAPAKETAAELIGITNDIGLITVHFYPQKLEGDRKLTPRAEDELGTKPGIDVPNPIFRVKVDLYDNPVEVWRIFYRIKGQESLPVPRSELVEAVTR